jgi:ubiquitin-conjugating enzyme E2 Z
MEKSFHECYSHYEATCQAYKHLNGQTMHDPFGEKRGVFDYAAISRRLDSLRIKLAASAGEQCELSDAEDTESEEISDN